MSNLAELASENYAPASSGRHSYRQMLRSPPSATKPLALWVDRAAEFCGSIRQLYSLHTQVRWDLVIILNMTEGDLMSDTADKIIPDPTVSLAAWAVAMSTLTHKVSLRDYRTYSGENKRLWLMNGSHHITSGMKQGFLFSELVSFNGENVNCFEMTEVAKAFWANGKEQNIPEEEILKGWEGIMSIKDDDKSDPA